jgi:hypothetical protein
MHEHDFLLKQEWDDYMETEYKRLDADSRRSSMSLNETRKALRQVKAEIVQSDLHRAALYVKRAALKEEAERECKHPKIIYVDGHAHQSWDYDWEHYAPEMRVCLSCGLTESATEAANNFARLSPLWVYKVLTGKPIRRFCTTGSAGLKGTSVHWAYVAAHLFLLSYPARIKAVQRIGYPVA